MGHPSTPEVLVPCVQPLSTQIYHLKTKKDRLRVKFLTSEWEEKHYFHPGYPHHRNLKKSIYPRSKTQNWINAVRMKLLQMTTPLIMLTSLNNSGPLAFYTGSVCICLWNMGKVS